MKILTNIFLLQNKRARLHLEAPALRYLLSTKTTNTMINIDKEIKVTKIYLVENCYGDKNKVYIGKSKTKYGRKSPHTKTYGNQILYIEIDEIYSIKHEDWEPIESFWIQYFKFLGFNVVNKRKKGGSGPDFQTQETKNKISKTTKGKSKPKGFGDKISKLKIGTKCRTSKRGKEHGNFGKNHYLSKETKDKISKSHLGKKLSKETIIKKSKPINQYNLEGNFIKEWISAKEARKYFKGDIVACIQGRQKTAGGYIWKFKENLLY